MNTLDALHSLKKKVKQVNAMLDGYDNILDLLNKTNTWPSEKILKAIHYEVKKTLGDVTQIENQKE